MLKKKKIRENDKDDADEEDVYFGDQHSGGGGLNVEWLTTVCIITGKCRMEKKI